MSTVQTKLRRVSGAMLILIPLLAAISIALVWMYWVAGIRVVGDNVLVIAPVSPVADRQQVGLVAALPGLAAWLAALWSLFRLFLGFRSGSLIHGSTVTRLRGFSLFSALAALLDIVTSGARRWAQGEFDGPLWTHIQIASEQQAILFSSLVFYIVSFALAEADEYREEAEGYL